MNIPYDQDGAHEHEYRPNISRKNIAKLAAAVVVLGLGTISDRPALEVMSSPTFYIRAVGEVASFAYDGIIEPVIDVAWDAITL